MSSAISLRARAQLVSAVPRGGDALLEAPALVAQRANLVEQDAHLARERLGEVVDVPAAQSRTADGMRARAHFGAPPLYALVVARGGLPSGDLTDMARSADERTGWRDETGIALEGGGGGEGRHIATSLLSSDLDGRRHICYSQITLPTTAKSGDHCALT
jgi:hypothetical protein